MTEETERKERARATVKEANKVKDFYSELLYWRSDIVDSNMLAEYSCTVNRETDASVYKLKRRETHFFY